MAKSSHHSCLRVAQAYFSSAYSPFRLGYTTSEDPSNLSPPWVIKTVVQPGIQRSSLPQADGESHSIRCLLTDVFLGLLDVVGAFSVVESAVL